MKFTKIFEEEIKNGKEKILKRLYDPIFDNLLLKKSEMNLIQYKWIGQDNQEVLERNHWGQIWIYDCELFKELRTKAVDWLGLDEEDFLVFLMKYLNTRYQKEFKDRPIRLINTHYCD